MHIKTIKTTPANIGKHVCKLLDIFEAIGIPVENTDRKLERMAKACMAVGQIKCSFDDALSSEDGTFVVW